MRSTREKYRALRLDSPSHYGGGRLDNADLGILSEVAMDQSKGGITMAVKAHPISLEDANVIRTALPRTTAAPLEIKDEQSPESTRF